MVPDDVRLNRYSLCLHFLCDMMCNELLISSAQYVYHRPQLNSDVVYCKLLVTYIILPDLLLASRVTTHLSIVYMAALVSLAVTGL